MFDEKGPFYGPFFLGMNRVRIDRPVALLSAGVLAFLIATFFIYSKGLQSGFLFDDWASLPALGAQGPVDHWSAFLRYITSGTADPTGRPLAQLSFLLDAHDWPASPVPFKCTNLLIHLSNGLLLSSLLWRMGGLLSLECRQRTMGAWLGGGIWMLHPLFASTVLYVVQREAMLSATFALLGMHAWLIGRQEFSQGSGGRAWVAGGITVFTVLGFLSKANGVLIPLLLIVIECCLPPLKGDSRHYRRWLLSTCLPWIFAVFLGLLWFAYRGIDNASPSYRGWSMWQRLLTEPMILWTYVGQLGLVIHSTGSVFHDQYPAASSPSVPIWTLPAIAALLVAASLAWRYRRRHPALAMAVLFFLAGHLVESSSIPLELYFEHRNYLPAMLLFWPLGLVVGGLRRPMIGPIVGLVVAAIFGTTTLSLTKLWGNPTAQALTWAAEAPDSARAQAYAAQMDGDAGFPDRALQRLAPLRATFAEEPQVALAIIDLRCQLGSVAPDDIAFAGKALQIAPREPGRLLLNWFSPAARVAHNGTCRGLDNAGLQHMLAQAAANPQIAALPGRMQDIEHIRGEIALASGNPDLARSHFDAALRLAPSPEAALEQAAALGRAGAPDLALGHLDIYSRLPPPPIRGPSAGMAWLHDRVLSDQNYWNNEFEHLRAALDSASRLHSQ
jgi:tetratricopeptide (TPR) repeat protein